MSSTPDSRRAGRVPGPPTAALQALARRACDGDRAAFDRLFEIALRVAWVHARAGSDSRARREARVEAILRRAFAMLGAWQGEPPFDAWLIEPSPRAPRRQEASGAGAPLRAGSARATARRGGAAS